jgi:hypothetical protein
MAHFTGPDVTSGSSNVPESHIGINVAYGTYTYVGTTSASNSFSIVRIPGGAKVVGANLVWDNDTLSTLGGATVTVLSTTGGTTNGTILTANLVGVNPLFTGPSYEITNYRHTSSSHAVVVFAGMTSTTGTATTIFTLQLQYICQNDGD